MVPCLLLDKEYLFLLREKLIMPGGACCLSLHLTITSSAYSLLHLYIEVAYFEILLILK